MLEGLIHTIAVTMQLLAVNYKVYVHQTHSSAFCSIGVSKEFKTHWLLDALKLHFWDNVNLKIFFQKMLYLQEDIYERIMRRT